MIEPLQSFLGHMKQHVREGRMVKSLDDIHVIVCDDQYLPAKILESVGHLHSSMERNDQSDDAGLAAVFFGIHQGKLFIKNANTRAQTALKEVSHLQTLTENVKKIDDFMHSMPEGRSKEFDWETASKLGVDTFHSLSEALTKGGSQAAASYKTVISTAKKSLSDFVSAVSKAFIIGAGLPWFQSAATSFVDTKTIAILPAMKFSNWKTISGSKCVSSDATSILKIAFDTESLIDLIESTFKSIAKDDCDTSAPVVMRLVDLMKGFEMGALKSITSIGLACEDTFAFFANMKELVHKISIGQVQATLNKAVQQIGIIMAKVMYRQKNIVAKFLINDATCSVIQCKYITLTHTYINAYMHACIHTYLHTYIHTHTYIHAYMHA